MGGPMSGRPPSIVGPPQRGLPPPMGGLLQQQMGGPQPQQNVNGPHPMIPPHMGRGGPLQMGALQMGGGPLGFTSGPRQGQMRGPTLPMGEAPPLHFLMPR